MNCRSLNKERETDIPDVRYFSRINQTFGTPTVINLFLNLIRVQQVLDLMAAMKTVIFY